MLLLVLFIFHAKIAPFNIDKKVSFSSLVITMYILLEASSTLKLGWILELDRGEGIPWKGNYSSWLDQKSTRLAQESKTASKRQKILERELDWVRQGAKGRQTKQKARLSNYDKLLNQDQKQLEEKLEIYIPNGPRLGTNVINSINVCKALDDKLRYDNLDFI